MTPGLSPGTCRHCGCTEDNACRVPPTGEPCGWATKTRVVCTNPNCLAAERTRLQNLTPKQRVTEISDRCELLNINRPPASSQQAGA